MSHRSDGLKLAPTESLHQLIDELLIETDVERCLACWTDGPVSVRGLERVYVRQSDKLSLLVFQSEDDCKRAAGVMPRDQEKPHENDIKQLKTAKFQTTAERLNALQMASDLWNLADGTTARCLSICPERETLTRERLLPYEEERYVKEYKRASADQLQSDPGDLRPAFPTLLQSVAFLCKLCENGITSDLFHFVSHRLHAVRKDLVQQNAFVSCGSDSSAKQATIRCLEVCVRFHVYSAVRLADQPVDAFSPTLNDSQTRASLSSLIHCQHDVEPQFKALAMIYASMVGASPISVSDLSLRQPHPAINLALRVHQCLRTNDAVGMWILIRQTMNSDQMLACAILRLVDRAIGKSLEMLVRHQPSAGTAGLLMAKHILGGDIEEIVRFGYHINGAFIAGKYQQPLPHVPKMLEQIIPTEQLAEYLCRDWKTLDIPPDPCSFDDDGYFIGELPKILDRGSDETAAPTSSGNVLFPFFTTTKSDAALFSRQSAQAEKASKSPTEGGLFGGKHVPEVKSFAAVTKAPSADQTRWLWSSDPPHRLPEPSKTCSPTIETTKASTPHDISAKIGPAQLSVPLQTACHRLIDELLDQELKKVCASVSCIERALPTLASSILDRECSIVIGETIRREYAVGRSISAIGERFFLKRTFFRWATASKRLSSLREKMSIRLPTIPILANLPEGHSVCRIGFYPPTTWQKLAESESVSIIADKRRLDLAIGPHNASGCSVCIHYEGQPSYEYPPGTPVMQMSTRVPNAEHLVFAVVNYSVQLPFKPQEVSLAKLLDFARHDCYPHIHFEQVKLPLLMSLLSAAVSLVSQYPIAASSTNVCRWKQGSADFLPLLYRAIESGTSERLFGIEVDSLHLWLNCTLTFLCNELSSLFDAEFGIRRSIPVLVRKRQRQNERPMTEEDTVTVSENADPIAERPYHGASVDSSQMDELTGHIELLNKRLNKLQKLSDKMKSAYSS